MKRSLTVLMPCTISCEVWKTTDMFNQRSQSGNHRRFTQLSDGLRFVASFKTIVRLVFVILMPVSKRIWRKRYDYY